MTPHLELRIQPGKEPAVFLSGKLTLGPHLRTVAPKVKSIFASAQPKILFLDAGALTEVDSAGLGELVSIYTTASSHNCRLCILRPSAKLVHLLEMTRLEGILRCFDNAEAARRWVSAETP